MIVRAICHRSMKRLCDPHQSATGRCFVPEFPPDADAVEVAELAVHNSLLQT